MNESEYIDYIWWGNPYAIDPQPILKQGHRYVCGLVFTREWYHPIEDEL